MVVLDFAPVSGMFNRSQPVWEGVWTGLEILQIVPVDTANPRCFIFALNSDNEITLWEIERGARFDATDNRIQWTFETPAYGFDTNGWNLRELAWGDLWINRMAGDVDFAVKFREDGYPVWRNWHDWEDCAQITDCEKEACAAPSNILEQFRARTRLPAPDSTCETTNGKPSTLGYRFQQRVEVTGFARIQQFRIAARDVVEDPNGACETIVCSETPLTGCNDTDYGYEIS
jgi:hypothetical protein